MPVSETAAERKGQSGSESSQDDERVILKPTLKLLDKDICDILFLKKKTSNVEERFLYSRRCGAK